MQVAQNPYAIALAQAGNPVRRGQSVQPLPSPRTGSPGRRPGDDTENGEASRRRRTIVPQLSLAPGRCGQRKAVTQLELRRGQISNVGKGIAGNTPASGNEGVGEHVRTRFQMSPKALVELRSS